MLNYKYDCNEKYATDNCKMHLSKTNHNGTEIKYKAVEEYVEEWFEKTKHYYDKKHLELIFNYIDVFSASGLTYDTKNDNYIEGTIARVLNVLKRKAINNPEVIINVFANDNDSQSCNCLSCYCKVKKLDNISNLNIIIKNKDYKDFIRELDLKIFKNQYSKLNINLVFYDPYRVEFDWEVLQKLFSLSYTDILINHIFPNDTKRGITQVKDRITIEKYEQAYGKPIDELLEGCNSKTVDEKDFMFRRLFHTKLMDVSKKRYIGYAPVIRDKGTHVHVFDLVVASNTNKACGILKNKMYSLYKEWINDESESNQLAFVFDCNANINKGKKSEFNFRYDIKSLGEILVTEFGGKSFDQENFYKIIEEHEYIPSNCKKELKDRGYYKIENKRYIVNHVITE